MYVSQKKVKVKYALKVFPDKVFSAQVSPNCLYLEGFLKDLNEGYWYRHRLDEKDPDREPNTQGWSYGLRARYFDGRVMTRSSDWVFAKNVPDMPAGARAVVFLRTPGEDERVGYLVVQS